MKPAGALLLLAAAAMAVAAFATGGGDAGERDRPASGTATAASAGPSDGRAVWVEHGCGSCHTLAAAGATGQFAPDLGATLAGMPASYIRESIVDPSAVAAAGYSVGAMPEDYGRRIPPDDLEALVAFIRGAAARD